MLVERLKRLTAEARCDTSQRGYSGRQTTNLHPVYPSPCPSPTRGEGEFGDPSLVEEAGQRRHYFFFSSMAFSKSLIPSCDALID